MTLRRSPALFVLLWALVAAACGPGDDGGGGGRAGGAAAGGGDASAGPATAEVAFPVTVEAANGAVEVPERPEAIVSLSPSATEMLFAVGAGEQVEAVDEQSDHPPEAPVTDLSGFEPNVEAIAAYEPDLVVASNDTGDLVASLQILEIPTLLVPAAETLEDTYEQIRLLGAATGNPDGATDTVEGMQADIDDIVAGLPPREEALTYYHELDPTYFTATSETFIGQVYGLLGLENIADAADDDGSGGYPQLSAEYIVQANPDLIFLADTDCCGQTPETVAARPGWASITAVAQDQVVPLDDDVASRWGPRVVDFLRTAAAAAVAAAEPVG